MRIHVVACADLIAPSILAVVDDTILHACATFRANRHPAERARRTFVHAATNRDFGDSVPIQKESQLKACETRKTCLCGECASKRVVAFKIHFYDFLNAFITTILLYMRAIVHNLH